MAPEGRGQIDPSIASDSIGNFIIAWSDLRHQVWPEQRADAYAQRFESDETPLGESFKVSGHTDAPYEYTPAVALFGGRICSTWTERTRFDLNTGIDVWMNVLDWNNPVAIVEDKIPLPTREGDMISITWSGGGEAEVADTVDGPWVPTGNTSGSISFDLTQANAQFLRVVEDR